MHIQLEPEQLDWRIFSDDQVPLVLRAARELFAKNGYHATSIRAIAQSANLSVPGLYYHYPSKQAILDALVTGALGQMLEHTRMADAASDGTAVGRYSNVVDCLLRFHMWRRNDAFVASTEMRSMEEDVLRRHIALRDTQQNMIAEIIEQGVQEGTFLCNHVKEASRAVSSLCVSVSSWYRPSGPLSIDELVARYLEISCRVACVKGSLNKVLSRRRS